MQVTSVVAYWTRTHVVMGLNPVEVNFFVLFHAATMLFNTTNNYCTKIVYLLKVSILGGTSADPTSQVRLSTMLLLPIVGK
jgi:hypothetical protein